MTSSIGDRFVLHLEESERHAPVPRECYMESAPRLQSRNGSSYPSFRGASRSPFLLSQTKYAPRITTRVQSLRKMKTKCFTFKPREGPIQVHCRSDEHFVLYGLEPFAVHVISLFRAFPSPTSRPVVSVVSRFQFEETASNTFPPYPPHPNHASRI